MENRNSSLILTFYISEYLTLQKSHHYPVGVNTNLKFWKVFVVFCFPSFLTNLPVPKHDASITILHYEDGVCSICFPPLVAFFTQAKCHLIRSLNDFHAKTSCVNTSFQITLPFVLQKAIKSSGPPEKRWSSNYLLELVWQHEVGYNILKGDTSCLGIPEQMRNKVYECENGYEAISKVLGHQSEGIQF